MHILWYHLEILALWGHDITTLSIYRSVDGWGGFVCDNRQLKKQSDSWWFESLYPSCIATLMACPLLSYICITRNVASVAMVARSRPGIGKWWPSARNSAKQYPQSGIPWYSADVARSFIWNQRRRRRSSAERTSAGIYDWMAVSRYQLRSIHRWKYIHTQRHINSFHLLVSKQLYISRDFRLEWCIRNLNISKGKIKLKLM